MSYLEESLHVATLLCKFGYFFQVSENGNHIVKEDGELYRFQVKTKKKKFFNILFFYFEKKSHLIFGFRQIGTPEILIMQFIC